MGKQIYFVHTEEDVPPFFQQIEKAGGKILANIGLCKPSDMLTVVERNMCCCNLSQYPVVYAPDAFNEKYAKYANIACGTAVEILNCRKWRNDLCTYYDKGRIYLTQTPTGEYDKDALYIYKKMCMYIKKEYTFVKEMDLYLSPDFKRKYDAGQAYFSQLGVPVIMHNE